MEWNGTAMDCENSDCICLMLVYNPLSFVLPGCQKLDCDCASLSPPEASVSIKISVPEIDIIGWAEVGMFFKI